MFVISMAAMLFEYNTKWDNYPALDREKHATKGSTDKRKGKKSFKTVVSSSKYTQYTEMATARKF